MIDGTLDKLIDYIRTEKMATKQKLTIKADFIENLDRGIKELRSATKRSLKAFYLYADATEIYYNQLVWADYEDAQLRAIAEDLQQFQAKYIEDYKVESLLNDLTAKLAQSGKV